MGAMTKRYSLAKYIVIFVLVQLAWLAILGLWIARYVANHLAFKEIDQRYAIHISTGGEVAMLVIGLVLIIAAVAGISVIFRYLNFHFRQTRMYDNFISSVTHELKTPLASIQLYLDTIASYPDINPQQTTQFIDQMRSETTRLNKMINSILEIGRLESKYTLAHRVVYEADEVLRSVWEDLRIQYGLNADQLHIAGQCSAQIVVDQDAIRLLFENLFDNSQKYSEQPAQIDITLAATNKRIVVTYRDYGVGIPKNQLNKIFKKFYRITDSQTPSVKGTGLGLYLVKGIVGFHRGQIKVQIPEDGKGLSFRIEIPIYNGRKNHLKKLLKSQR
jgi:two-component system phosphate regulon sensor histidine kinase PhoR